MNVKHHTRKMLLWLEVAGIKRLDLAVRQSDTTMVWQIAPVKTGRMQEVKVLYNERSSEPGWPRVMRSAP